MNLIKRPRKSPFIQRFEPPQIHGICPGFWKLTPGIGCPYSCSYCFLNTTLRSMTKGEKSRRYEAYTNVEKMMLEITKFIAKPPISCAMLNMGETMDSLATTELKKNVEMVVRHFGQAWEYFEKCNHLRHLLPTLLLLTKSTNIPDCDPTPNVVLSWSINAPKVAGLEKGAPKPIHRWNAALKAKQLGWRVRVRIDPIVKVVDPTEPKPRELTIESVYGPLWRWMHILKPERITLGTMRRSGKPTLPAAERIEIYKRMIAELNPIPVGLCKETPDVYAALGIPTKDIKCNCTV